MNLFWSRASRPWCWMRCWRNGLYLRKLYFIHSWCTLMFYRFLQFLLIFCYCILLLFIAFDRYRRYLLSERLRRRQHIFMALLNFIIFSVFQVKLCNLFLFLHSLHRLCCCLASERWFVFEKILEEKLLFSVEIEIFVVLLIFYIV